MKRASSGGEQLYRLTIRCPSRPDRLLEELRERFGSQIARQMRLDLHGGGQVVILMTDDVSAVRDVVAAHAPNGTYLRIDPAPVHLPQQRTS